jgi:lipoprotein signal peptidase
MNSKQKCSKKSEKIVRLIVTFSIILFAVFLDQTTKILTHKSGKSYSILSDYLAVIPVYNPGMAFGMLGDWKYAKSMFKVLTIILLVIVGLYVFWTNNNNYLLHISISFLVGGTIGNFIDRVKDGKVKDFLALDLRIPILQFNCNVADIFITIGAVLLFIYILFVDPNAPFKKRKDEETARILKYAETDILEGFLPILDNFERAISMDDNNFGDETSKCLAGFRMVYNQTRSLLEKFEVKEIECLGKEFDPSYAQAVVVGKDETQAPGVVLEVFQKGYMYKDRVLRIAMVKVNE